MNTILQTHEKSYTQIMGVDSYNKHRGGDYNMTEITRQNIVEYLEYTYDKMVETYKDSIISEIKVIIERLRRDSTVTTVKSSVEDLQVICNVLVHKYSDDDLVGEFQSRINDLANLFSVSVDLVEE